MGLALMRWGLGLLLLASGLRKLMGLSGFVTGYLVPAFEETILPGWLVTPYGYTLPLVEALLGVLLILGLFRSLTLFVTGLTFLSLAFGQMLLRQNATVANIYLYLTMTGILLYLGEHDRWIVATKSAPETESPTAETKE
jgi:thiosulfate dehydrogenase [quinone] large subunit